MCNTNKNEIDKQVKQKLNVNEYIFEINSKDIYSTNVKYYFKNLETTFFENGKKIKVVTKPILSIELEGIDKDDNIAWLTFDLKADINDLNELTKKPTDITNLLIENEIFIKKPKEINSECLNVDIPKHSESDIYKNLTALWILKKDKNEFIIKLSIPNEVFTVFKITFISNNL